MNPRPLLAALAALIFSCPSLAEDGYDLWLKYRGENATVGAAAPGIPSEIVLPGETTGPEVLDTARGELMRGLVRVTGNEIPEVREPTRDGALVIGTPQGSRVVASLSLPLEALGPEGYLIRSIAIDGKKSTVIAAKTDVGVLYGVFHFLRMVQTHQPQTNLDIASQPRTKVRLLNHWDNLDQHVERG